jgi:hypothetical protein
MPPVLRMRRSDFVFTPIGMASEDLRWMARQVPGLQVLFDTSHAGLYLNARRVASGSARVEPEVEGEAWLAPLLAYLQQLPSEATDLIGYADSLQPHLANAQISNAAGLLGEGLPYGVGDFDLDPVIRWLNVNTEHIVTETLESSNDDAVNMRDALRRMRAVAA